MQSYVFLLSLVALITPLSASSLHLTVPTSNLIPTPSTLPPSSHATLTTANLTLTAPIRRNNVFSFYMLPRGSYLCDVNSRDHAFAPFRVDVNAQGVVEVWQTFRGNEWDNRGERVAAGRDVSVDVKVVGKKNFYESRGGFSPMSLLQNPMILIAVFGMAMMVGMPYLMENMDPETKKEFMEQQKSSPLAAVTSGGGPMQGFDMAGWMAGKTAKSSENEESRAATVSTGNSGGGGGGGKSKNRKRG